MFTLYLFVFVIVYIQGVVKNVIQNVSFNFQERLSVGTFPMFSTFMWFGTPPPTSTNPPPPSFASKMIVLFPLYVYCFHREGTDPQKRILKNICLPLKIGSLRIPLPIIVLKGVKVVFNMEKVTIWNSTCRKLIKKKGQYMEKITSWGQDVPTSAKLKAS